ncbi:unnamed protein product [Parascedosporium putredinis]|uniref:Nucleoside phosphorylase domain-containing protein n=1 Tax=Parascedosporium putredinis TaxID=1442378 RepID=A0A9P1MAF4_9PEZI|nr:unnamed protein product [Parascedosporium putredinis]CAI7992655.1 unnamed protein product [Parascedosporium putredinis]
MASRGSSQEESNTSERKWKDADLSHNTLHEPKRAQGVTDNSGLPINGGVDKPQQIALGAEQYTVGWICAIHPEYVSAQAVLDNTHEAPEFRHDQDNNNYTLGSIGKHHVVIATLPSGEYGLVSAASVARDMLRSFPNVKIGLMVGLGGGAPSDRHDIRLGDVVVSVPGEGEGGVMQYDYGRTIQHQAFQQISHLNKPPAFGNAIDEMINDLLQKARRLRKLYSRPAQSTDQLYNTSDTHAHNDITSCTEECGDPISRPQRTEDDDNPAIHYGLIASANQLMKDAITRDKLATEKGVLCFEMEAAGLMNHFPCLVIRGICDYSDTHKNKDWQGYAALAAAIYAQQLLYEIPPAKVRAEGRISDMILKLKEWLNPPDYSIDYEKAKELRHTNTNTWILEADFFQRWSSVRSHIYSHGTLVIA